ncbi:uncharacterized protein LOC122505310 [Leptopilina heterotoma]|uniref:uncharacterized protein LOC122505310 n=1 Tax=Leptopilina heterotoma TaxID=63436 RepID=UPI001CA92349|nr:uncharacterized protein LOC122505310 [Leptopilina heterotoma]
MISIAEICRFSNSTPSCRNFTEGEKVLRAKHVIYCGKKSNENSLVDPKNVNIIAFCLKSSGIRENPHEITGLINDSNIVNMKCSCKAGMSEKCKHVIAVLFQLHVTEAENLDVTACTDTKCLWSVPQKKTLETYNPLPLRSHECFTNSFNQEYPVHISEEDQEFIKDRLYNVNLNSSLTKHLYAVNSS